MPTDASIADQPSSSQCSNEREDKRDRIDRNRGLFGLGADWEKIAQIQNEALPSCERLTALTKKYYGGRNMYSS